MKAGRSQLPVGTRVRLAITDPLDIDLNGRVGALHRPFHNFPIRDVGVLLDPLNGEPPTPVTVYLNEFEVINK